LHEVGYLPIDQRGADLLFRVVSQRSERGSIVITSNKAFKASVRNRLTKLITAYSADSAWFRKLSLVF
jgi:DNA replication protein DnaC